MRAGGEPAGVAKRAACEEALLETNPTALFADGLDDAIIGIIEQKSGPTLVAYDWELVVRVHERMGMRRAEAEEFVDFNVTDAYMGPGTPVFLYRPWEDLED